MFDGYPDEQHAKDCPGVCIRLFCLPHGKHDYIGSLRAAQKTYEDHFSDGYWEKTGQTRVASANLARVKEEIQLEEERENA